MEHDEPQKPAFMKQLEEQFALSERLTQSKLSRLAPQPMGPEMKLGHLKTPAESMYERVKESISEFEQRLTPDDEVGACLVSAPGETAFHIESVGFWGMDMLIFYGTNVHGKPIQLMQHISQLSILLTALPKQHDVARRIGFDLESENRT
jgi:hypothetical protein